MFRELTIGDIATALENEEKLKIYANTLIDLMLKKSLYEREINKENSVLPFYFSEKSGTFNIDYSVMVDALIEILPDEVVDNAKLKLSKKESYKTGFGLFFITTLLDIYHKLVRMNTLKSNRPTKYMSLKFIIKTIVMFNEKPIQINAVLVTESALKLDDRVDGNKLLELKNYQNETTKQVAYGDIKTEDFWSETDAKRTFYSKN